jgi:DNA repair photolyase
MTRLEHVEVKSILTRSSGYLRSVCSHSLNPYRGCTLGRSLCGVACYVQHNRWITGGRPWGSFVEAKVNAVECYRRDYRRERAWAHRQGSAFTLFLASSTDPFLPQEQSARITRTLLQAMLVHPPDRLIVQTHSAQVCQEGQLLQELSQSCEVRVHLSIEGDRDRLPGLPPPAYPVAKRLQAAAQLRQRGLWVVATLAPLFPILHPALFFARLQECVEAVVVDHFIQGDGSPLGQRTRRTALPEAMEVVHPGSTALDYRQEVVAWARSYFPGRVGVGQAGFAGHYE